MANHFNILAFTGGGVRGVLSVTLLKRLLEIERNLLKQTDIVCGASTGSIIAAGVAYGMSIEDIMDAYSYENCKYIFTPAYTPIFRTKYDNEHLRDVILSKFPSKLTLNDLPTFIVIPTFFLGTSKRSWNPIIFNNLPGSSTGNVRVVDVLLASTAAPVFFPEHIDNIDGAIYANDPSMIGLIYALSYLGVDLLDASVLSIGSGSCLKSIPDNTSNWGMLQWMLGTDCSNKCVEYPLLDILLTSNIYETEQLLKALLRFKFNKINPKLQEIVLLDDYNAVPYLKLVGEAYPLDTDIDWIDLYWNSK